MAVGPYALSQAQVGERWVVRIRTPDGSATDLVGWLASAPPDALELWEVSGVGHSIEPHMVVAARRAPAALGGPDPRRVPAAQVQRHAVTGWLASSEPLGEWTLRSGGGFTGRANSAQAVGDPGMPLPAAAGRVVAYAEQHSIAAMAQVIDGSAEQAGLLALGWVETHERSDVLVARLADFLGDRRTDPRVRLEEALTPAWRAAYQQSRPNDADPAVLEQILGGHPPLALASVSDDGENVAIARGHRNQDWLGLAAIWTHPDRRRRGLATALMVGLGHWAARQGARYVYLQVAAANAAAITAYGRLGFVHHHSYGYLKPGDAG